jgi:hypothetical protein
VPLESASASGAFVILGIVIVPVVFIIVVVVLSTQRYRELVNFAKAHGWTYTQRNDSILDRFSGGVFDHPDRMATDIFEGEFGPDHVPFIAFTYGYMVHLPSRGENKKAIPRNFAVCALGLERALPPLEVTREGATTGVSRFFGGQDIELESDDFNRTFRVRSPNVAYAYAVLHPEMMELLLGPGLTLAPWHINGYDFVCFEPDLLIDVNRFPYKLHAMIRVMKQIPELVWDEYGR